MREIIQSSPRWISFVLVMCCCLELRRAYFFFFFFSLFFFFCSCSNGACSFCKFNHLATFSWGIIKASCNLICRCVQCCNGTGRALTFGRIKRWRPHEFRDKITALFDFGWRLKTGVFLQLKYFEVGFFFLFLSNLPSRRQA